jgi:DNA-binding transcriptional MerR regulator
MLSAMKLGVYSAAQACRLAKISETQLRYWNQTHVFRPHTIEKGYGAFRHVYLFRDIVGLRTISLLRNEHKVKLADLREVERRLKATPEMEWANLVFYMGEDRQVYFDDPVTRTRVSVSPMGQSPLFKMREVITSVERQLKLLNRRTKAQIGKVQNNRFVMRAASVVAGTRILTSSIYDLHHEGFTTAQIIREFPRLTERDVHAAINFERLKVAG